MSAPEASTLHKGKTKSRWIAAAAGTQPSIPSLAPSTFLPAGLTDLLLGMVATTLIQLEVSETCQGTAAQIRKYCTG